MIEKICEILKFRRLKIGGIYYARDWDRTFRKSEQNLNLNISLTFESLEVLMIENILNIFDIFFIFLELLRIIYDFGFWKLKSL